MTTPAQLIDACCDEIVDDRRTLHDLPADLNLNQAAQDSRQCTQRDEMIYAPLATTAGELSLLSAMASGDLASAHQRLGRFHA
ncbi:hypothetical protein [Pseudomonas sp. R5(2019)]|uniref:hypothetical protein n=1 Tax=Pseudomonas sp. R5(2019) TaxID=2697566 RepID=UPI001412D0EF|nr:hypothetical protein [Pseudomonas sp. R5(2019)]NBA96320.1 hypothetical protein [Pseudomonas sp. R5(2019)]